MTTPISQRFSAAARTYTASANIQNQICEELIRELPPELKFDNILDVGCGTGLLTKRLSAKFPSAAIKAIDIAPGMIAQAQQENKHLEIDWVVADAGIYFDGKTYDLIAGSSSLHWMFPLEKIMHNLSRLLADKGEILIAMMLRGTLLELHQSRLAVAPHKVLEQKLPTAEMVFKSFEQSGFTIIETTTKKVVSNLPGAGILLNKLHQQGVTGGPVSAGQTHLNRNEIKALVSHYEKHYKSPDGGVIATYQVLFVRAKKWEKAYS